MGRCVLADGDGPGWRTLERRRASDRAFLAAVLAARTFRDLHEIWTSQSTPIPTWRRVALVRLRQRLQQEKASAKGGR